MTPFPYIQASSQKIHLDNHVIGHNRQLPFQIASQPYTLRFVQKLSDYKPVCQFKVGDEYEHFWVGLNRLPAAATLDNELKDIRFENLPESVSLMILEFALANLLKSVEKVLKRKLSLEKIEHEPAPYEYENQVFFELQGEQQSFLGHLDLSSTLYTSVAHALKNIPATAAHPLETLPLQASIALGSTVLSTRQLNTLKENDIVLIEDNNFIENQTLFIILSPTHIVKAHYNNGTIKTA